MFLLRRGSPIKPESLHTSARAQTSFSFCTNSEQRTELMVCEGWLYKLRVLKSMTTRSMNLCSPHTATLVLVFWAKDSKLPSRLQYSSGRHNNRISLALSPLFALLSLCCSRSSLVRKTIKAKERKFIPSLMRQRLCSALNESGTGEY